MRFVPDLLTILVVSPFIVTCGGDEGSPTTPDPPPPPNELPLAGFSIDVQDGAAPLAVTFDGGGSSDPDGSLVAYLWTFGDGATSTGLETAHTYMSAGEFRVELTVRDDGGGEASTVDFVYVSSPAGQGPNRIEGSVWYDSNMDGTQGSSEEGLHRFPVFLDADGDGSRAADESVVFTASDGSFAFPGLDPSQQYTVTQALPFGWSNTTPALAPAPMRQIGGPARIINGEASEIETFPFQVALLDGDFQFCGGSLINSRYVLTAAHCVVGRVSQEVDIMIGTHDLQAGGQRVGTTAIRIHPEFSNTLDADVALLRLAEPLLRHRVYLQSPDQPWLSVPGDTATVIGWGQTETGTSSSLLKGTELPIITNDECGRIAGAFFANIGERTICAGASRLGTGPCFGDSGGPLLVRYREGWAEIGVVSFSVNVDQCGNIPGAYARVSTLYDYIVSVARLEESGAYEIDWSSGPVARVDFGNFH